MNNEIPSDSDNNQLLSEFDESESDRNSEPVKLDITKQRSEISTTLNDLSNFFELKTHEDIAANALSFCHNHHLNVLISINLGLEDEVIVSSSGEVNTLELRMLNKFNQQKNSYHFGKLSLFVYHNVSVLALNMPDLKSDQFNLLNDYLSILTKTANSCVNNINSEKSKYRQRQKLIKLVEVMEELMLALETKQDIQLINHTNSLHDLMDKFQSSCNTADLTHGQEDDFTALINEGEAIIDNLFIKDTDLKETLKSINKLLELSRKI